MKFITSFFAAVVITSTTIASADPVGGSITHRDYIRAHDTDVYRFAAIADETTVVRVRADDPIEIDCWLYDEGGHVVAEDTTMGDICRMQIRPVWTGSFTLRVRNYTGSGSMYSWRAR